MDLRTMDGRRPRHLGAQPADLLARCEGLLPFRRFGPRALADPRRKRIRTYPPTEPFLDVTNDVTNVKNAVRSPDKQDVPYEPWFDDDAVACDPEPGDMPHWALNGPHRVENHRGRRAGGTW
jgi:hypothetical protein